MHIYNLDLAQSCFKKMMMRIEGSSREKKLGDLLKERMELKC